MMLYSLSLYIQIVLIPIQLKIAILKFSKIKLHNISRLNC